MIDERTKKWISAVLANDEVSTDSELWQYFMKEGKMNWVEAMGYIAQRNCFAFNLQYELKEVCKRCGDNDSWFHSVEEGKYDCGNCGNTQ